MFYCCLISLAAICLFHAWMFYDQAKCINLILDDHEANLERIKENIKILSNMSKTIANNLDVQSDLMGSIKPTRKHNSNNKKTR